MSERPTAADTQTTRWAKYGLNTTIAAVAAVVIVIMLNAILYMKSRQNNLDRYLRFDFTSTREYTLSPQTQAVLKELKEPYRIVSMLAGGNAATGTAPMITHANSLIDEYARYSNNITVDHIDPVVEPGRLNDFYISLKSRYADRLKPEEVAIKQRQDALDKAHDPMLALSKAFYAAADAHELQAADVPTEKREKLQVLQSKLQLMAQILARYAENDAEIKKSIAAELAKPMPNYTGLVTELKEKLTERAQTNLAAAIGLFGTAATDQDTPAPVRAKLDPIVTAMHPIHAVLADAVTALGDAKPVEEYDKLLEKLALQQVVVILSPKRERIITVQEMFKQQMTEEQASRLRDEGGNPLPAFQGEERLTGTLVSLGLKIEPLVVFVASDGTSPSGQGGNYSAVADRLRTLNFDVQDWSPMGRPNMMGQPAPPAPPPQPKPGQKAVWIFLPVRPPSAVDPSGSGAMQVSQLMTERLKAGDGAMVLLDRSSAASFGGPDPVVSALAAYDVRPQTDRLLLREIQMPNNRTRLATQQDISHWPTGNIVSLAVMGMNTTFYFVMPIELDVKAAEAKKIDLQPLVEIQSPDVWAEHSLQEAENIKKDPATAGQKFIAGVAVSEGKQRLIVFGDPVWATDKFTTYGALGAGTADLTGAAFPGNSELFVNSVYWLAGLDQLIAASARTQDIRRVRPLTDNAVTAVKSSVFVGMPLLIGLAGIGVWFVRRRG